MLISLQAVATHLATAAESLLHVQLFRLLCSKLSSVVCIRRGGGGLSASAVCLASKWFLRLDIFWW